MRGGHLLAGLLMLAPSFLAAQTEPLAPLGWMAGCWQLERGARTTFEMWMPPAGGLMIGGSRTVVSGVTREFEHVRIRWDEGRPVYHAMPSGQSPASFPGVGLTDSTVVFENLNHDFPQRIRYARRGPDSLVARIEGPGPSGPEGIDFPMRRVACERP